MLQILLNGVVSGLLIALLGLGFFVVYLPTRIFHVALGAVYVVAPLVAWSVVRVGFGIPFALLSGAFVGTAISIACELVSHKWLERHRAPAHVHFVASLGLFLLAAQTAAMFWGTDTKVLRTGLDGYFQIGSLVVTNAQTWALLGSLALLPTFGGWLGWTGSGLAFRALASNPKEAMLRGYNVDRLRLTAFAWSGLLASSSSLLLSLDLGFSSEGGLAAMLLAAVASILGGRDRFAGPVVGGVLLGLLRTEVVWLMSARWQEAVSFLALIAILFLKPDGLLGQRGRLEAEA